MKYTVTRGTNRGNVRRPTYIYIYILWRIDPLLSGDSENSDRFWATAM
jgi:hypothetical protein